MSEEPIAFHGIVWTEKLSRPKDGRVILTGQLEGRQGKPSSTGDDDIEKKAALEELSKAESKRELALASELEYPHGLKLVVITVSVSISVFIMALDQNIITTAVYSLLTILFNL